MPTRALPALLAMTVRCRVFGAEERREPPPANAGPAWCDTQPIDVALVEQKRTIRLDAALLVALYARALPGRPFRARRACGVTSRAAANYWPARTSEPARPTRLDRRPRRI